MNTTIVPANVDQMTQTIIDQHGQPHSIELRQQTLLLDKLPTTLSIVGADELHLVTEAGSYAVTAQAFWHAFAGGAEPTAIEAGLLLADSLMREQALQQMQQLQIAFQRMYSQIQALSEIPLPAYRLSPFIQQALDAYDGTTPTTQVLARILKQDETVITMWARSLGKVPLNEQNGHHPKVQTGSATKSKEKAVSQKGEASPRLQWSTEMDAQLVAAFEASTAESVKDAIAEIAQRFQWPFSAVYGRVYKLKLNEKKRPPAQQHPREPESSQEADQSSPDESSEA